MKKRVLVVEDDVDIAELIRDYLEIGGFDADVALDGMSGCELAIKEIYDLVLLDVMLPQMDGFEVLKRVRAVRDVPILMVSARKEDMDKIRALGIGADDYVTKPFSPSELMARVGAHLARYERLKEHAEGAEIALDEVTVDLDARKVTVEGQEVVLANREYELLVFLAKNPNRVFSRDVLFERIWGMDSLGDAATVTVHVGRLREKLAGYGEKGSAAAARIETVRGAGYRFRV